MTRHVYEGTDNEPLTFTVRSSTDLLDATTIELTLNAGSTWIAGTWQGVEGPVRKATITLTTSNVPAPSDPETAINVYARVGGDVILKCEDDLIVHALT